VRIYVVNSLLSVGKCTICRSQHIDLSYREMNSDDKCSPPPGVVRFMEVAVKRLFLKNMETIKSHVTKQMAKGYFMVLGTFSQIMSSRTIGFIFDNQCNIPAMNTLLQTSMAQNNSKLSVLCKLYIGIPHKEMSRTSNAGIWGLYKIMLDRSGTQELGIGVYQGITLSTNGNKTSCPSCMSIFEHTKHKCEFCVVRYCSRKCTKLDKKIHEETCTSNDSLTIENCTNNTCVQCSSTTKKTKLCGTCFGAQYCSKECQKLNWAQHKKVCNTLQHAYNTLRAFVGEYVTSNRV
jgi:hypothetical protein